MFIFPAMSTQKYANRGMCVMCILHIVGFIGLDDFCLFFKTLTYLVELNQHSLDVFKRRIVNLRSDSSLPFALETVAKSKLLTSFKILTLPVLFPYTNKWDYYRFVDCISIMCLTMWSTAASTFLWDELSETPWLWSRVLMSGSVLIREWSYLRTNTVHIQIKSITSDQIIPNKCQMWIATDFLFSHEQL